MILGITGHRPHKLGSGVGWTPLRRAVVRRMAEEFDRLQPSRVIQGMALGVDRWAGWLAHRRSVPFTAAVPFTGQFMRWSPEQRQAYGQLLELAASEVDTSIGHSCSKCSFHWQDQMRHLFQVRNEWIVDHCDVLLAVWDGSSGGTANCVAYAEKVGRETVRIDPKTLL